MLDRPLPRSFYARATLDVARGLLGCRLVKRLGRTRRLIGAIVETEAYIGEEDRACHATRGCTERNAVMFGPPGHAYVYFIYGMYHMLNVVTEKRNQPAAVLIRAVEPLESVGQMARWRGIELPADGGTPRARARLTAGPGRLCQAFRIDRSLNGADLCRGAVTIERGPAPARIETTPRIGVDYAGEWSTVPWRFIVAGNPFVSRSGTRRRTTAGTGSRS